MGKKYRSNFIRFSDSDANVIGRFIDEHSHDGQISPRELVDLARPKNSPIHHYFDWDDQSAAEKYRLRQARQMIRCLVVIVDDQPTRAFQNVYVKEVDSRQYVETVRARSTPELWKQVLDNAMRDADSFSSKYSSYRKIKPIGRIISVIEAERKKHEKQKNSRNSKGVNKGFRNSTHSKKAGQNHNRRNQPVAGSKVLRKGKTSNRGQATKDRPASATS